MFGVVEILRVGWRASVELRRGDGGGGYVGARSAIGVGLEFDS